MSLFSTTSSRRRLLAVTSACAALIAGLVLAPSAYATDTNFLYELNPQHNFGKCLDIQGGSTANGARLIQFDCNNQANQRFRFNRISSNIYEIRPVHGPVNMCLDVAGASNANGARVIQFRCNGGGNQRFRLLDDSPPVVAGFTSRIVAVHSNKCLDVAGASNANGAQVIQFTCNGQGNQRFDGLAFAN